MGTFHLPLAQLCQEWHSSISFWGQFLHFLPSSTVIDTMPSPLPKFGLWYFIPCSALPFLPSSAWDWRSSFPTNTSQSAMLHLLCISHSLPPHPVQCFSAGIALLNAHQCSSSCIDAPRDQSAPLVPHIQCFQSLWNSSTGIWWWSDSFSTTWPPFRLFYWNMASAQSLSTFLSIDLVLFLFIPRSSTTFPILPIVIQYSLSGARQVLVVSWVLHPNMSYCLSYPHLYFQLARISVHHT